MFLNWRKISKNILGKELGILFGEVFLRKSCQQILKNGHTDWWKIILLKQAVLVIKIVKFMLIEKM
jgi:hypothetical protein